MIRNLIEFFRNLFFFRKEIYNYRKWDYIYSLTLLKRSLEAQYEDIKNGCEVAESRVQKAEKIERALQILEYCIDDSFLDLAEAELGEVVFHDWEFEPADKNGLRTLIDKDTPEEKEHNHKVFTRADEIQQALWSELFLILKGTGERDGTDMRGWWT
jgi:hypothetical protein